MISGIKLRSAMNVVKKAFHDRLNAALSVPVFTGRPTDNTTYEYVVIGNTTEVPWNTKTHGGVEITQTVHAWSRQQSPKPVGDLVDEILQSITGTDFDLSGDNFAVAVLTLDMNEIVDGIDGFTIQGVLRFRLKIQDTTP